MSGVTLLHGDCLELMDGIPDNSVDLVLCDPPYGTTACSWDTIIPFDAMWTSVKRVLSTNGCAVLFGSEPFSSYLRLSNIDMFKYDFYWRKSRPSGFTNAKLKPLKDIETISVFSMASTANGAKCNMKYNPQGVVEVNSAWSRPKIYYGSDSDINPTRETSKLNRIQTHTNYPRQILDFQNPNSTTLHPTQKPVDLLEYIIKTYTDADDMVLDFTMGSGSTGVACKNTGRRFTGIEKELKYFDIASERISQLGGVGCSSLSVIEGLFE